MAPPTTELIQVHFSLEQKLQNYVWLLRVQHSEITKWTMTWLAEIWSKFVLETDFGYIQTNENRRNEIVSDSYVHILECCGSVSPFLFESKTFFSRNAISWIDESLHLMSRHVHWMEWSYWLPRLTVYGVIAILAEQHQNFNHVRTYFIYIFCNSNKCPHFMWSCLIGLLTILRSTYVKLSKIFSRLSSPIRGHLDDVLFDT